MNFISIGFWVMTLLCLGLGTLWGLSRGLNRAALRIVLVILCAVLAFALRGTVTDSVWGVLEQEGILDNIMQNLPAGLDGVLDIVKDLINVVMYPIIFVVLFFVLRFLSWAIVFPICKLFIRMAEKRQLEKEVQNGQYASVEEAKKAKDHQGIARKRKGFGALVGLAQGVVVAICFLMPLGAMVYNVGKMMPSDQNANAMVYASAEGAGSGESGSSSSLNFFDGLPSEMTEMFSGYSESVIGKFYGKVCASSFDSIASVKTDEGRITFSGVTEIVVHLPNVYEKFENILDESDSIDFHNKNSLQQLQSLMAELDEAIAAVPETGRDTISAIVAKVANNLADNIDSIIGSNSNPEASKAVKSLMNAIVETLAEVKFTDIKFADEIGVIIEVKDKVMDLAEENVKINDESIGALMNIMKESKLIVPLLNNIDLADFGVEEIDDASKAQIDRHLDNILAQNPDLAKLVGAVKKVVGLDTAE